MSALEGKITIPHVGSVPKKVLIPVVGVAAAFVGYRYYVARSSAGTGTSAADTAAGDFGDGSAVPDVLGAVSPDNSYGISDTSTASTQTTSLTTNAAWSQSAAQQLTQSDTWSYTDIVQALGAYLAGTPLTTLQQAIVRSAIAVTGYPPVGAPSIISGGDTAMVVAPTGLKATTTSTTATLTVNPVAGAGSYRAYDQKSATNIGSSSGPTITVGGLLPNTSYTFHVRALSSSGQLGPASEHVTVKTAAASSTTPTPPTTGGGSSTVKLTAPKSVHVVTTAKTATLTCAAVAGATEYRAYHQHSSTYVGKSSTTTVKVSGLAPKTGYVWHMRAFHGSTEGPASSTVTMATKA